MDAGWFAMWNTTLVPNGTYAFQSRVLGGTMTCRSRITDRVSDLADRSVDELSGGQRQRVWIAMALAQGTDIMLLDEPTTFLDLTHQIDVLDLLCDLNREHGRTIVCVLHDLNLACRYTTHLVAMRDGHVTAWVRA